MLGENDRLFQDFACFRIDRLLNSNDASCATSVTLSPLDCLVGGLGGGAVVWTLRPRLTWL